MRNLLEKIENYEQPSKWDSFSDADAWLKGNNKKYGRGPFQSSDEFKKLLPEYECLRKIANSQFIDNQKKKADELGFVAGKKVESQYGSMLTGMQTITGTTVRYKGKPMVKLDHKIDVAANGKIREGRYVNYSAGWKEIGK